MSQPTKKYANEDFPQRAERLLKKIQDAQKEEQCEAFPSLQKVGTGKYVAIFQLRDLKEPVVIVPPIDILVPPGTKRSGKKD